MSKSWLILVAASIIFFFLYNYLNFFIPGSFNSPDETANAVFIRQIEAGAGLQFMPRDNYGSLAEFIHPRSTFVIGRAIVPVGFWGLPMVYGGLARAIGAGATVFVTPALYILAVWCFFFLLQDLFGTRVALFSSILALSHPALAYYVARGLFPNLPFLSLAVIAACMLIRQPLQRRYGLPWWLDDGIGLLLCLVAALIRPSEMMWALGIALVLLARHAHAWNWKRIVCFACAGLYTAFLFIRVNQALYIHPVGTYISSDSLALHHWYSLLFPFGVHPKTMIRTGYMYGLRLLWWLMVPAAIGFAEVVWRYRQKTLRQARAVGTYMLVFSVMSSILWVYYGSFFDPLFSLRTIGVSYARYWTPIFLLLTPFTVLGMERIGAIVGFRSKTYVIGTMCLCLVAANIWFVFQGSDGILATGRNIRHGQLLEQDVLALTDPTAILVTDREDKFFWPQRQVMVKFFHPDIGNAMGSLIDLGYDVYYEAPIPDMSAYLNSENYLTQFGLQLGQPVARRFPHSVYPVIKSTTYE